MICGDFTPDILLHALAVTRSKRISENKNIPAMADFVLNLILEYHRVLRPRALLPLPVNGTDIANEFGLKPSALFRRILRHVREERMARQTLTRAQAIKIIEKFLEQ